MDLSRKLFKQTNLSDPFFDSLKADYKEFPEWFKKKANDYAYVFESDAGEVNGFLYLKVEDGPVEDVKVPLPPARRLKVGTFKINAHGTKLGERFLKKIFDHAISEGVTEIYVTLFPKHAALVKLFAEYGFSQKTEKHTDNGIEFVLVKNLQESTSDVVTSYPLVNLKGHQSYLLSLYPKWHTRLLPDSILATEDAEIVQDISHTNSIHKVYLAAMEGMGELSRGDVLLIYRTTDHKGPAYYRSVATSLCVVEEYRSLGSFGTEADFLKYCQPYSVFTRGELKEFWLKRKYPHVIRFMYNIALKRRVNRGVMIDLGFDPDSYWGFMPLDEKQLLAVTNKGQIDESLIIH